MVSVELDQEDDGKHQREAILVNIKAVVINGIVVVVRVTLQILLDVDGFEECKIEQHTPSQPKHEDKPHEYKQQDYPEIVVAVSAYTLAF